MIGIRAARGLGDAIHLRAGVLHLLRRSEQVKVFTPFPVVFADLPVATAPVADGDAHEGLLHFAGRLSRAEDTDNFTASCARAGLSGVDLRMDWKVKNPALLSLILDASKGKPILVYQPRKIARNPAQELIRPALNAYNGFIADHHDHFRVRLGQPPYVEMDRSAPCEFDLFGKTSIPDAFDIATIGDLFFGESCYVPMLGEAMDRKYAIMFTRRALNSSDRVANMKPSRLFHKKHLATAVYDESN